MMHLPNASRARVERSKVVDDLLNEDHPDGDSKALFFRQFGVHSDRWEQFAEALGNHAMQREVREKAESEYGTRYVIEGPLHPPDGRNPVVRTVWIVDSDASIPRLVTAYPIE